MNHRFEVRKARYTPIVVSHDAWPWPEVLVATDVSPRGLFIAGDRLVPEGDRLRLSFRLGTRALFEPEAYVVRSTWNRRLTDLRYSGMGVELVDVTPLDRTKIRELVRTIPPPVPLSCLQRQRVRESPPARRRAGRSGGRRHDDPRKVRRRWGAYQRVLTLLR